MAIRGRGNGRGRGRGRNDPPQPSQSCTSPPPPHTSFSPAVKDDRNKGQNHGLVKGLKALKNQQKLTVDSQQKSAEVSGRQVYIEERRPNNNIPSRGGVKNDKNKGQKRRTNNNIPSRGAVKKIEQKEVFELKKKQDAQAQLLRQKQKSDDAAKQLLDEIQRIKSQKVFEQKKKQDAQTQLLRQKQKSDDAAKQLYDEIQRIKSQKQPDFDRPCSSSHDGCSSKRHAISSSEDEENDEYYEYDDGEDEDENEEMSNGKMSNATSDSVSHSTDPPANDPTSMPLSGGSHVETDRKKVIYVDAINPRRFVPQSVTRDIISTVITRMPIAVNKWKDYPVSVKDDLFLDFKESYDTIMLEKYGEDTSMHPIVDSEVWAKVSGPKKRRIFGGYNLDNDTHGSMATSSSEVIGPSCIVAPTQEDIKEAVNIAMTSFVQTQLMPMLEPILSIIGGLQVKNVMPQAPLQGGVGEEDHEDE